jgi:HK97 family phage major capsid protein
MKWIKYLKDDAGRKAGEVAQIDDNEYPALKRLGFVEDADEPKEVKAVTTDDNVSVKNIVRDAVGKMAEAMGDEFKKAFPAKSPTITTHDNVLDDPTDGFKSMGEFATMVQKSRIGHGTDERLIRRLKANGASENVDADGGYATPVQFSTSIWNDVANQTNLLPYCTLFPMSSNTIKLPSINYTTEGSFGVAAYWEGEGNAIPTSKAAFRQPQLTLNKLTCLTPVTSELLEDGLAIETTISYLAAQSIAYKITDAILFGTGAGQPTGIVGHASTVSLTRNTTVSVKAIDVIGMQASLMANATNPMWLINKGSVEPQLLTIQDGAGRYLYFSPGSFAADPNRGKLLGKPVIPLPNSPSVGTVGDIILTDLKGYVVGYKSTGVSKAMSIHLYFNTDEVAYRWTFRMDGRPWRDTTLSAARGSAKYGTNVTLTTL